ncbi:YbaN family protein [Chloroflexota bacterium]
MRTGLRISLIIVGTLFTGLGIIGIFVPILPTTPFLLLAIACYSKSSKTLYDWLINNKWLGNYIRNYIERKVIPLKLKVFVIALIWITIGSTIAFAVNTIAIRVILIIIAVSVSIYFLSRKTLRP